MAKELTSAGERYVARVKRALAGKRLYVREDGADWRETIPAVYANDRRIIRHDAARGWLKNERAVMAIVADVVWSPVRK